MISGTTAETTLFRRRLIWLGCGALGAAVLSVTGTFAPLSLKRLVLFHGLYGAACGYVLGWLAEEIQPPPGRWLFAAVFLLSVGGCVNLAWLSFRQFETSRRGLAAEQSEQVAALNMLEKMGPTDPESRARYAAERRKYAPEFTDYLAHRVSALGTWSTPWPEFFWLAECLTAGGVACGMFHWRRGNTAAVTMTNSEREQG
ncbi:hypothetical protein [Planctomicrobium sp. SH664]|uniref:hypothetical protein n=1 Tax=Planctomicrobium sp. SH664 TaxID=3448125 RepID=UPI003F5BF41B